MNKELYYARKFIILKTQYSNMKDLNQKGHGKLEKRGHNLNINFNIQGAESTNYYDILLIGKNKAHRIGSIYTEENRRGNAEFTLSVRDLESLGFPLRKINGVLILRNSNILLGGYFQKDDKSIEKYISSMEKDKPSKEDQAIQEPAVPIEVEDKLDQDLDQEVMELEPADPIGVEGKLDLPADKLLGQEYLEKEDIPLEEDLADKIEKTTIDGQEYYGLSVDDIVSTEEYSEALEEVFPEGQYPEPDFYENFHIPDELEGMDMTLDYILNILNYFPYIEPFRIELKGYSWWKIEVEDVERDQSFLPYFKYILNRDHNNLIVDNPITSSQLINKYKHYIFGLYENKDGVKLYIYGIPGLFRQNQYPQAGTTGFNTWFEGRDFPGYWLLYLEANSGRILYPINPMIPRE